MNVKQKAVKGIVWSVIQNWGSQAIALMVFFILARLLGPADFGLVALANVFLVFMQLFLGEGFAKALIQRQHIEKAHLDTVFWLNLAVSILLCGATLAFANTIAQIFEEPALGPILRGVSVLFIVSSFSTVQQAVLERDFAFKAIAMRSLLGIALSGVVGVAMALSGFGVWSLVGQQIVYEVVSAIVLWQLSDWRPAWHISWQHLQELWNFGVTILGFNVLIFFHTRVDDLLIGYFLDTTALGYYSLAHRILATMTNLLINTSNQVALPTFSRLQDNLEQLRIAYYQAIQLSSLIAFPAFFGVAVLAQELIIVIFGNQWLPAVPVLQLLSLAGAIRSATYFKTSVLMAINQPQWSLGLGVVDTTLSLIAFAVAAPWGITAIAWAYLIRGYVMLPFRQWVIGVLIHTPFSTYVRQFATPAVSTLLMVAAMLMTKGYVTNGMAPWLILLACSSVGCLAYGLAIILLAPNVFKKLQELTRLALGNS